MKLVGICAAVAVLSALGLASTASAGRLGGTTFQMPSRNIGCLYQRPYAGRAASLRCDILSGLRPQPRRACAFDWVGISMPGTRRASATCGSDTVYSRRAPVLRYGWRWQRGPFTCRSRRTGLSCSSRAGHGFMLARRAWRVW